MINDPRSILNNFGVPEGAMVADLGVGVGHIALALSEKVGEAGKVFAVDIQKPMLERLSKEAMQKGIKNIEIIWGDIEVVGGTKIRAGIIDVIVIANVLFQIDAKAGLVHECARIIREGGRLLIVDWSESFGGLGPKPSTVVDAETARRIFETGPFQFIQSLPAGDHHYALVFEKRAA